MSVPVPEAAPVQPAPAQPAPVRRRPVRVVRRRRGWRRHFSPARIVLYSLILVALAVAIVRQIPSADRELDVAVITSFMIIGVISVAGLATSCSRDGMSLAVIFWFFNVFFFFIAPVAQYRNNGFNYALTASSMLIVNVILIAYSALFWITYSKIRDRKRAPQPIVPRQIAKGRLIFVAILSAIGVATLIAKKGLILTHSMIRALGAPEGALTTYAPQWMMLDSGVRPFFWFLFLFALFAMLHAAPGRKFGAVVVLLIAVFPALIINAPTSSSRYYVFTTYFGLLLTLYKPTAKRSFVYLSALLLALFASIFAHVVRETVSIFKDETESLNRRKVVEEVVEEYNPFSMQALFVSRHFDPYENTVHTYDFITTDGVVWGRQALGGFLFFVPRAVWPEKPVGTGAFVTTEHLGKYYDINFTNVTSPPIMEAMVNFGVIGALVLAVFLGWVIGNADRGYADARALEDAGEVRTDHFSGRAATYLIFYPPMVGFSLFLLRGDFLSGMAYGSGIAAAYIGAYFIFTKRLPRPRLRPATGHAA